MNTLRLLFVFLAGGILISCSSSPKKESSSPNRAVINKDLPGIWKSSVGDLTIGCSGSFDFKRRANPNVPDVKDANKYGKIGNGLITQVQDKSLKVRTFPGLEDEFAMTRYPYQEAKTMKMDFYDGHWTRTKAVACSNGFGF
jgi:hypothetical protein